MAENRVTLPSYAGPVSGPRNPKRPRPPAIVFREEIEKAEQEGVKRADLTLRLTLGDTVDLKRDRSLALEDISFSDGVMSYLGVKVASGGVTKSVLDRDA